MGVEVLEDLFERERWEVAGDEGQQGTAQEGEVGQLLVEPRDLGGRHRPRLHFRADQKRPWGLIRPASLGRCMLAARCWMVAAHR